MSLILKSLEKGWVTKPLSEIQIILKILEKGSYQFSSENPNNSKIPGGGSYPLLKIRIIPKLLEGKVTKPLLKI